MRRLDAAIVALAATAVLALAVTVVAVLEARSGGSNAPAVVQATATPGGSTAVPWVDSTEGPTISVSPTPTSDPSHASTRPCHAADLTGAYQSSAAATAMQFIYLGFSNISTDSCRLSGSPQATLLDANGEPIPWDWLHCSDTGPYRCAEIDAVLAPGAPTPTYAKSAQVGQARLELEYDRCDYPIGQCHCVSGQSAVAIDLPDGGDRMILDFPSGNICTAISVGQFEMGVQATLAPGVKQGLAVDLDLPDSVEAGQSMRYFAYLTNTSAVAPWFLGVPCPNYNAFIGDHIGSGFRSLNCLPVGKIDPGQTVSFNMELSIPSDTPSGEYPVYWTYWDGQSGFPAGGFVPDLKQKYQYHVTVIGSVTPTATRTPTERCPEPTQPCYTPD